MHIRAVSVFMKDPTEFVFLAAMAAALLVFAGGWIRHARGKTILRESVGGADLEPPRLPAGKVITWPYHGYDLFGISLVFMIFFGMGFSSHGVVQPQISAGLLVQSIFFQLILAGVAILVMVFRVSLIEWLGLKWAKWPSVFLIAPGSVIALWVAFGLLQLVGYMRWMESLGVETMQETVKLFLESRNPLLLGLMTIAAVLVAPVCEEVVFRGYLYGAAKKFTGGGAAAIFSGLVFAVAHGSLSSLLPLFLVGMVLVLVYEKTGSLWAPVAVHFCFNGATVAVQFAARVYGIEIQ